MWIGVLGPTAARGEDGAAVALAPPKHRALLATLASAPGRAVSDDVVFSALWGDEPPRSAAVSLASYASHLRRLLEPGLPARSPSRWLTRTDRGYVLQVEPGALDATDFARTVSQVHEALGELTAAPAPVATDRESSRALLARLDSALRLWRGTPYADVVGDHVVEADRARLTELRALAEEDRATLLVALGREAEAVGELEALVEDHPLRERLWVLLAAAQARVGRQADALHSLERLRRTLDEQLGLPPSAAVRQMHLALLRQEVADVPRAPRRRCGEARVPALPFGRCRRGARG